MRTTLTCLTVVFSLSTIGLGAVRGEEFLATINKVDGTKVTFIRVQMSGPIVAGQKPGPAGEQTLVAGDTCKITSGGKLDSKTRQVEGGKVVAEGLKSDLFKKNLVLGRIVTEGQKITAIKIAEVKPANEFTGVIKKIEGNKIVIMKFSFPGVLPVEATVIAADDIKVLKRVYNREAKKFEAKDPLEGGLKSERLSQPNVSAEFVVNDDGKVAVIRVMTAEGLNVIGGPRQPPQPPPPQ